MCCTGTWDNQSTGEKNSKKAWTGALDIAEILLKTAVNIIQSLQTFLLFTTQSRLLTTQYKKPFENIVEKKKMLVTFQNKFEFFRHVYFVIFK